jgi:hypothetical chaperone protein
MALAVGIDFGTSNSAAAVPGADGGPAQVVAVDPHGEDQRLLRSVVFFPEESVEVLVGGEAVERYMVEGEGRFLQSVKSFLPSATFTKTEIRRKLWGLEELVAVVLRRIRERIEAASGARIERAVFGRPAVFHEDAAQDARAQERLRAAAVLAGFPEPVFVIEPIAAALRYEEGLARDEVVLVGDFGAGTSDFTVMRLGPSHRATFDRRPDVLGSSGVYVGGDKFDAAIVEHRLLEKFGHGSRYRSLRKVLEIPVWMTRKLLAWHELALLRDRSTMAFLYDALKTSDHPREVENLITLAEENLGYRLYRAVEQAKRELSENPRARVRFEASGIELDEPVTRAEFEVWTAPLREQLMAAAERALAQAGVTAPDAVFLTGGTSRIPSVRALFAERFGEERLREGDAFTSVAAGLGRAAGRMVVQPG